VVRLWSHWSLGGVLLALHHGQLLLRCANHLAKNTCNDENDDQQYLYAIYGGVDTGDRT
jgi:hypothetical protein